MSSSSYKEMWSGSAYPFISLLSDSITDLTYLASFDSTIHKFKLPVGGMWVGINLSPKPLGTPFYTNIGGGGGDHLKKKSYFTSSNFQKGYTWYLVLDRGTNWLLVQKWTTDYQSKGQRHISTNGQTDYQCKMNTVSVQKGHNDYQCKRDIMTISAKETMTISTKGKNWLSV